MKKIYVIYLILFCLGCSKTTGYDTLKKGTPLSKRRIEKVFKKYIDKYGWIKMSPNDTTIKFNRLSFKTVEELDSALNNLTYLMNNIKVNVTTNGKPHTTSKPLQ